MDRASLVVRGKPSAALAERLERDEKARIAAQVEDLGPEGLKQAEKELDEANAENEKPIPKEILTSFPLPDIKNISWISVQSVQEKGRGRTTANVGSSLAKHIASDGTELAFFVQYDHVQVLVMFLVNA